MVIAFDAKGSAYPVMSMVFRVSSAFGMADEVFGSVRNWAQFEYKSAGDVNFPIGTIPNECGQHCQAYRLARPSPCIDRGQFCETM